MKTVKITLTLLLAALTCGAAAQTRDISLKIVNQKDKPMARVAVASAEGNHSGMTGRDGVYVFKDMADDDHILVLFSSSRKAVIPVAGLDSVLVKMQGRNRYDYARLLKDERLNIGYGTIRRENNTTAVDGLDVEKIVNEFGARNLIELLRGRVAGLEINVDGTAVMRGMSTLLGSNEPLVILDGMEWGTIKEASDQINVRDLKTVTVIKDGTGYGSRGANGVILLTTK